jgi:hypothetical protein
MELPYCYSKQDNRYSSQESKPVSSENKSPNVKVTLHILEVLDMMSSYTSHFGGLGYNVQPLSEVLPHNVNILKLLFSSSLSFITIFCHLKLYNEYS